MMNTSVNNNNNCQHVNVSTFYGVQEYNKKREVKDKHNAVIKTLPRRLNHLFGPTQIWKVFNKQCDALEFARTKRNGVMTFAFQQSDGVRAFLVAHPQVFWFYDVQKKTPQRCSYEIIPESTACKLYFDLEFDKQCNQDKDGAYVVDIFISVILHFLSMLFNIKASKEQVLNLDSTTDYKFSRHLIFQLNSHVFCDNKSVGEFVHFICQKLKLYLSSYNHESPSSNNILPAHNTCKCCETPAAKNSGCVKDTGLSFNSVEKLMVFDKKGKMCLVCDENVYTRNRHFRLFQNTKWKKNAPLLLSADNLYMPTSYSRNKVENDEICNETLFLSSLVSYSSFLQISNNKDIKVLHFRNQLNSFEENNTVLESPSTANYFMKSDCIIKTVTGISPYPEVDKFINSVVFPGHIWRSVYFSLSSVIVYDIIGNRYCQNIGRQHKSNNVKYIVNLDNYTFYQKCHDYECSTFRSMPMALPPELKFKLEDDSCVPLELLEEPANCSDCDISDYDLMEVTSAVEDLSAILFEEEL